MKIQRPIILIGPPEVNFDAKDLKEAILWYADSPVFQIKHVFLYGYYYAISIKGKKLHIHRLLMAYWLQRKLKTKEYVHHKDENKFNNLKDNLQLMAASLHQSITNKGRTYYARRSAENKLNAR